MIREYIQSEEEYKGYVLKIRMYCLDDRKLNYHRECIAFKDGKSVGRCKTKKEMKELIDGGYIQMFEE